MFNYGYTVFIAELHNVSAHSHDRVGEEMENVNGAIFLMCFNGRKELKEHKLMKQPLMHGDESLSRLFLIVASNTFVVS